MFLRKGMVDMETGERGFLITSKDEFLEPYEQGQKALKQHVAGRMPRAASHRLPAPPDANRRTQATLEPIARSVKSCCSAGDLNLSA